MSFFAFLIVFASYLLAGTAVGVGCWWLSGDPLVGCLVAIIAADPLSRVFGSLMVRVAAKKD